MGERAPWFEAQDANLGARVQEARRALEEDEASVIAYLLGESVEDVRRVLPAKANSHPESQDA